VGSQQLRPLKHRLSEAAKVRRNERLHDRRWSRARRADARERRWTRILTGWTSHVHFALDWFKTQPQVSEGYGAVGVGGRRPSDKKRGRYTPATIGVSHAKFTEVKTK
jgi:hypothetical protein